VQVASFGDIAQFGLKPLPDLAGIVGRINFHTFTDLYLGGNFFERLLESIDYPLDL
jgi:hypothetical protein